MNTLNLLLPTRAVPDRVSRVERVKEGARSVQAELDGPGCIRHIFLVLNRPSRCPHSSRKAVLRIYFDDEPVPHVEAPVGDFFGVMHGEGYYDINCRYLSVKAWNGYNCYFPMPFAKNARFEIEGGPGGTATYLQVDWHRYPGQAMEEPKRFCARWRRECPARSYGENFLILDADGPGQLLGFSYGVRLLDNQDRWSHGGADNIYIDGHGSYPAMIRGIGGEDCFGAGYAGNLHPVDSHFYDGLPFYSHDDQGLACPAPRVAGYRFFDQDFITFEESLQFRFGCMQNDICSTAYWYQEKAVRPFSNLPPFAQILPESELLPGSHDLDLPECGSWLVGGPIPAENPREKEDPSLVWIEAPAHHGFIDFNHYFRPTTRGVGRHHQGMAAIAKAILQVDTETEVALRVAWDDCLTLRLNDSILLDQVHHSAFRDRTVRATLAPGQNIVEVTLTNERGFNHGGWALAFRCQDQAGNLVYPVAGFAAGQ